MQRSASGFYALTFFLSKAMIGIGKYIPLFILHKKEERTWTRTHTVDTLATTTASN